MNELRAHLETDTGREWVRRGAWAVLALAFLAFVIRGGSSPADPYLVDERGAVVAESPSSSGSTSTGAPTRRPLEGFGEISFVVTDPAGAMAEWCALLAETHAQQAQGLMHQEDLRGYDAMVFRYDQPVDHGFWMKDTIIPLAIAFFDAEGRFVSAEGMEPCPPDVADCPSYRAAGPYQTAIEVPRGGLGALGIGPGSTVALGGRPCP